MPVYHALIEHGQFEQVLVCNRPSVQYNGDYLAHIARRARLLARILRTGVPHGRHLGFCDRTSRRNHPVSQRPRHYPGGPLPAELLYKITKAEGGAGWRVTPVAAGSKAWDPDRVALYAPQDDCLIAIEEKKPVPVDKLQQLPPWHAVMIARLAAMCGGSLERGTVGQMVAEAVAVGGSAELGGSVLRKHRRHSITQGDFFARCLG